MMPLRILFAPVVLLLASCATTIREDATGLVEKGTDRTDKIVQADPVSRSEPTLADDLSTSVAATHQTSPRPEIDLSEDLLYRFLIAEIAGHQGQLDIAANYYQELAQTTQDPKVVERAVRVALYAEDDRLAECLARLWLDLIPDNPAPLQILAVMAIRKGALEQAVMWLRRGMEGVGGTPEQKLWLAANLLGREKDQSAVAWVMERMAEDYPDNPDVLFALAQVVGRLGDVDRALHLLIRVLVLQPNNESASFTYINFVNGKKDTEAALIWFQRALQEIPDNFPFRYGYAALLIQMHRYDEAHVELLRLIREQPGDPRVLYSLGFIDFQLGQFAKAESWFLRLRDSRQHISEAHYYLGRIAEQNRDFEQATRWYSGVHDGLHHLDARVRISFVVAKQGDVEKARQQIRSIVWQNEEQRLALIQAEAEILSEAKRYEEAVVLLDEEIEEGVPSDLLYTRALLAEKLGRMDMLEQDLRALLDQNPDNATVLNALGYSLADNTDRYEEAHALIQRALDLSPNDFHILDSMGWVLYRMGNLDQAERFLRQAITVRHDPEIAAHLGEVLWMQGERLEASAIWETALERSPDNVYLLEVIQRLKP